MITKIIKQLNDILELVKLGENEFLRYWYSSNYTPEWFLSWNVYSVFINGEILEITETFTEDKIKLELITSYNKFDHLRTGVEYTPETNKVEFIAETEKEYFNKVNEIIALTKTRIEQIKKHDRIEQVLNVFKPYVLN